MISQPITDFPSPQKNFDFTSQSCDFQYNSGRHLLQFSCTFYTYKSSAYRLEKLKSRVDYSPDLECRESILYPRRLCLGVESYTVSYWFEMKRQERNVNLEQDLTISHVRDFDVRLELLAFHVDRKQKLLLGPAHNVILLRVRIKSWHLEHHQWLR